MSWVTFRFLAGIISAFLLQGPSRPFSCSVFAADWNLEIDPVGIADDGKYQCQVTPQRSRDAYVNVHVPPEDPFIEDGPVLHVKESVEVKLECVARGGKPPAKVSNAYSYLFYCYFVTTSDLSLILQSFEQILLTLNICSNLPL